MTQNKRLEYYLLAPNEEYNPATSKKNYEKIARYKREFKMYIHEPYHSKNPILKFMFDTIYKFYTHSNLLTFSDNPLIITDELTGESRIYDSIDLLIECNDMIDMALKITNEKK